MSEHVEGLSRNQTALFPETLEGYVNKDNPVRFTDAFVDSLNMEKLGFKHSTPLDVGRPSYDPSDLLKLYIYGYLNQIRSSMNFHTVSTHMRAFYQLYHFPVFR